MIKRPQFLFLGFGLLAVMTSPLGVRAARAADQELLDILLANGAITQQQYERLLAQEELSREDLEGVVVDVNGSGLQVESEDFEFTLGGRLHHDYNHHAYDSRIGADPANGTQIRRARLEMDGVFHENWAWAAEVDFQDNKVGVKDFKIGYLLDDVSSIFVGSQKQPYSLSVEMSSNDIPFVERSIDNALVIPFTDRGLGVRYETSGDNWFFAGGVFGDRQSPGGPGDEGWGPSARFIYAPLISENSVVHLGVRGSWYETDASNEVDFETETKEYFSQLNIIDTGDIPNVEDVAMVGPEFGFAAGPLWLFGEYNDVTLGRTGEPDLDFNSWHVAGTWALTGESRASGYRIDAGEFKALRPAEDFSLGGGGFGAWELAARYASVDANDGAFTGGSEERVTGGLNWYPNSNVRFMFDWTHVLDTDESNTVRRYAPGMDIYTLRAQYNW